jgi:hypothetical protein
LSSAVERYPVEGEPGLQDWVQLENQAVTVARNRIRR